MRDVMVLAHAPSSTAVARRGLLSAAASAGVSQQIADDAALVLSELVGNAIRHSRPLAGGVLHVGWAISAGSIVLRVTDGGGPGRPHRLQAPTGATGGRGLWIVDCLTDDWGVQRDSVHTTVWAQIGAAPAGRQPLWALASG